jgi:hypothetical protein
MVGKPLSRVPAWERESPTPAITQVESPVVAPREQPKMSQRAEDVRLISTQRQLASARLGRDLSVYVKVATWYALAAIAVLAPTVVIVGPELDALIGWAASFSAGLLAGLWFASLIARKYRL